MTSPTLPARQPCVGEVLRPVRRRSRTGVRGVRRRAGRRRPVLHRVRPPRRCAARRRPPRPHHRRSAEHPNQPPQRTSSSPGPVRHRTRRRSHRPRRALGTGTGVPLVVLRPVMLSHLHAEWRLPFQTEFREFEHLAARRLLVRMDPRGAGLSDREVADQSLEARVSDIEAVVDRLGVDRFRGGSDDRSGLGGHRLHGAPPRSCLASDLERRVDAWLRTVGHAAAARPGAVGRCGLVPVYRDYGVVGLWMERRRTPLGGPRPGVCPAG